MIADLFRKDYRQMTAQGVTFTPEDIVRLNALAVKVRLSQNGARTAHLPRLAFLPARPRSLFPVPRSLVLREPTIAHDLWLEQAQRYIKIDSDRTFDLLYGFALSRPAEKLPDAFAPDRLIRKVFTFAARELAHLTREQLSSAVDYVLFGADWTVGEVGPAKEKVDGESRSTKDGETPLSASTSSLLSQSPTIGLLTEARAIRLPITLDDAKRMTASELDEAICRALLKDRKIDQDEMRKSALGEYVRAREEIRRRSVSEGKTEPSERQRTERQGE